MQHMIDTVFAFFVKQRNSVIRLFQILSLTIVILTVQGSWYTLMQSSSADSFYRYARTFGEFATLCFILTQIPGIARRFKYSHKFIMILMMFRRQLGVLTYLFVLNHALILRIIPWAAKQIPQFPMQPYIFFGLISNMLLAFLFITSNDLSVRKLGVWWDKVQHLTYLVVWGIFLHLAFIGIGKWTILIGATAVAQIASHVYASYASRHR